MIIHINLDILTLFAEKPICAYDIWQKTKIPSYATVWNQIHHLSNLGLIVLVRLEPSSRGGSSKHLYSITLKGSQLLQLFDAKMEVKP